MNGMPFEMILTQPLAETFAVEGIAPNVIAAHNMAWDGLGEMLGGDDIEAWSLKVMQHAYNSEPKGVAFHAEFVRNPEFEAEA